ncbi:MAG TPA: hypothetical protein VFV08_17025, partial [Puia sp.]|nr:hypothetical protein [Puia sp.]
GLTKTDHLFRYLSRIESGFNFLYMKELIDRLKAEGLTEKQAFKAIEIIKDFAKEKFPLFGGAIDKLFDKYSQRNDDDFMP